MRTLILLLLSWLVIRCTAPKASEASVDSTTVAVDSAVATPAPAQVQIALVIPSFDDVDGSVAEFPEHIATIYSEDPEEAATTGVLDSMLRAFDAMKLITVHSNYTAHYEVGNDYDESMESATQTETNTWYYDSALQLRAYSHDFEDDHNSNVTIYLFEGDKIIAVYVDNYMGGQDTQIHHNRWIASRCPACGVRLVNPREGEPAYNQVESLDEQYTSYLSTTFSTEYAAMIALLLRNASDASTNEKNFILQKNEMLYQQWPYTVQYTLDKKLGQKLLNKE